MGQNYIDLHIHSTYSDGDKKPIEILQIAEKLKLKYISITDHENCKAYEDIEKINIKDFYQGKLITGCELMTNYKNIIIEILGYNVNTKIINKWYEEEYSKERIQKKDQELYKRLIKNIQNNNLILEKQINFNCPTPYSGYFKLYTYNMLKKQKENTNFFNKYNIQNYEDFIRKGISNPQNPLFIKEIDYITKIEDIIKLIHNAGGKAFIAHLYKYNIDNHIKFLQDIIKNVKGIDGIECNYSSFTKEQTTKLLSRKPLIKNWWK